jgi:hypothetical protein
VAKLYIRKTIDTEDNKPVIYALTGEDHDVAFTFSNTDEEEVVQVCLTRDEIIEAFDVLNNQ